MMSASILSGLDFRDEAHRLRCNAAGALCIAARRQWQCCISDGRHGLRRRQRYSWEEWKKIRDTYQQQPAPTAAVSVPSRLPAASCITAIYYDEFPSEDERSSAAPAWAR